MIKSSADGRIEDTGPLTKKRMETVDVEVTVAAMDFMERAVKADKPFFVWWNSTRMHVSGLTSSQSPRAKQASAFMQTVWSNTLAWWVSYSTNSKNLA